MSKTVYRINWDNGGDACGTFPRTYETEAGAQAAADDIEQENIADGVWDEDGYCEVIAIEEPDEDDLENEMTALRRAALDHRGQP